MSTGRDPRKNRSTKDWKPGRGTKIIVALVAGFVGLVTAAYPRGYGWGGAILAATAAMAVPIFAYRSSWKELRFWIPFVLLAALQAPMVIFMRGVIEDLRFPALFIFGISDCLIVLAVIYWTIYWPRSRRVER